jgi:hypothetical protein
MKRKPILGEILFDLNVGNAARRGSAQMLTPVVVVSVGRKYFTCAPAEGHYRPETTYALGDWREKTEHFPDHQLYQTAQEWEDEKEVGEIHAELRAEFNHHSRCKVPLETLRAIRSLLANDPDETREH